MKKFYRKFIAFLYLIINRIEIVKIKTFEWLSILRKRKLYKDIKWTKEQKKQFNEYWKQNYGEKISPRWHKLYQSFNGKFDIKYIPEIIFTTEIEPIMNNREYVKVLEDKNLLEKLVKSSNEYMQNEVKIPKNIIAVSNGIYYFDGEISTKEKCIKMLSTYDKWLIKPSIESSSGRGISIHNKKSIDDIKKIFDLYSNNYCVQEVIYQSDNMSKLNNSSLNTLRLITYVSDGKIYNAPSSVRIGGQNQIVDNIHAGGVCVGINEDGSLKQYAYKLGQCDNKERIEKLDSGLVCNGYIINSYNKALEVVKELHKSFYGVGCISWDVAIDQDDIPVIIECNLHGQSAWFPQIINEESLFGDNLKEIIGR